MQKLLLPLLLMMPMVATAADSQITTCSLNNQQRVIEIITNDKGCEVHYSKGADTQTLWNSPRSEYCAKPAADFIEKQKSWGWSCAEGTDTSAPAPTPQ